MTAGAAPTSSISARSMSATIKPCRVMANRHRRTSERGAVGHAPHCDALDARLLKA